METVQPAMRKTWIKICGLTNLADALAAVDAGADAVGFVFAESPRQVTPALVAEITHQLPLSAVRVGIFVNEPIAEVREALQHAGLNAAQLHVEADDAKGWDALGDLRREGAEVWPAISAQTGHLVWMRLASANSAGAVRIFVDSGTQARPGGTGQTFDWDAALPLVRKLESAAEVVIAGGLRPENVAAAVHQFSPFGVDVSSGVESAPGKKDHGKIRAFVAAVRAADAAARSRNVSVRMA